MLEESWYTYEISCLITFSTLANEFVIVSPWFDNSNNGANGGGGEGAVSGVLIKCVSGASVPEKLDFQ